MCMWTNKGLLPHSFWVAPYFDKVLDLITKPLSLCVVSFDESFNKIIQQEQMDLILRFGIKKKKRVMGQYSQFLGHTRAIDIISKF